MDVFKQYYAHIQDNLCAFIQENSFLRTFICIYSRHNLYVYIQDTIYMHIFKINFICIYSRHILYAYIQDKFYMHIFKTHFICIYSRSFYMHIFKTHFICIYTFKIQFISLYLSRSPVYIIHEEYLKNWPEPTENHTENHVSTRKF